MSDKKIIELRRSDFAESFLRLDGRPFSLDDYPHMRAIYNDPSTDIVLKFSRQCVDDDQILNLANGVSVLACKIQPGQKIIGFNQTTFKNVISVVKNKWDNGQERVLHIKTRTGRSLKITANHPIWTANGFVQADKLNIGSFIALSRNNTCALQQISTIPDCQYKILAYMLAEGGMSTRSLSFTNTNISLVKEFEQALKDFHSGISLYALPQDKYPGQYRVNGIGIGKKSPIKEWFTALGLYPAKSQTKFHPDLIYNLSQEQLKDYLRIWWDTDGYWSTKISGDHYVGIALISQRLVKGIQILLLKLGIHSTIKVRKPKIYENTDKHVYVLALEGQDAIKRFYNQIKTKKAPQSLVQNSNKTHNRLVIDRIYVYKQLKKSRPKKDKRFYSPSYNVSYEKLKKYLDTDVDFPELKKVYNADFHFDKVVSIENLGKKSTTAIEIEGIHTFQIDGILTKNTSKSTTLANIMVSNSSLIPYFRTLYVAPTVDQTKVFSRDRVAPILEASPLMKEHYLNTSLVQNVFMKQLLNGSRMYLRYALLSGDHLRGYSSDMINFDEVQDLKADIIPVVQETMSRSLYKRSLYSGTPKRTKGTLADLWFSSTQNEYLLKCPRCNHWNLLDDSNIGPHFLICNNSKCGKELNTLEARGEWVSTYSNLKNKPLLEGYRVCLLHFAKAPWVSWEKDVVGKMKIYSKAAFYNEVLALEYDHGVAPITRTEVMAACSQTKLIKEQPTPLENSYKSVMGIDYGPVNSTDSYTIISVIQLRGDGKFHVVYAKKFIGKEADYAFIHEEIPRLMNVWSCDILAGDYGMGEAPNGEIQKRIGEKAVIAFQHSGTQKEKMRWNKKMPAYTLNRNQVMNGVFALIKDKKIVFPKWEDSQIFLEDILNIQTEYNEELGKSKYINVGPDDFFHATLYAILSTQLAYGSS